MGPTGVAASPTLAVGTPRRRASGLLAAAWARPAPVGGGGSLIRWLPCLPAAWGGDWQVGPRAGGS